MLCYVTYRLRWLLLLLLHIRHHRLHIHKAVFGGDLAVEQLVLDVLTLSLAHPPPFIVCDLPATHETHRHTTQHTPTPRVLTRVLVLAQVAPFVRASSLQIFAIAKKSSKLIYFKARQA